MTATASHAPPRVIDTRIPRWDGDGLAASLNWHLRMKHELPTTVSLDRVDLLSFPNGALQKCQDRSDIFGREEVVAAMRGTMNDAKVHL